MSINDGRDIIATWRTATVVSVGPAKPIGIQVEEEVIEVCNAMRCAEENHIWLQGGYYLANLHMHTPASTLQYVHIHMVVDTLHLCIYPSIKIASNEDAYYE